ncbi:hypothetical protein TELCIR_15801, partial [Teladorsagia circumcincta]
HVPCWMEKWVLGYLASLMRMSIREPDSVSLLKIAQSKKSTIRRSSILRDLKRIKNHDHRRGGFQEFVECDCLTQDNHVNNVEMMSHISRNGANGGTHSYKQFESESAFLGRIVEDQIIDERQRIQWQWQQLASVVDRLLLVLNSRRPHANEFDVFVGSRCPDPNKCTIPWVKAGHIIDERQRIQWQWQQLAYVVGRILLVPFSLATLFTITFFLLLPRVEQKGLTASGSAEPCSIAGASSQPSQSKESGCASSGIEPGARPPIWGDMRHLRP